VSILRTIARHGMSKGAAFFYAVAVGAAANLVLDYVHHRNAVPVADSEIVPARAVVPGGRTLTAPIASRRALAEPRPIRPSPAPTTASLPVSLPPNVPGATLALPDPPMPSLPKSSALPTPALQPAALPAPPSPAPAAPAASTPNKPAAAPLETVVVSPPPTAPKLGDPVSLLPLPAKPAVDPAPPDLPPAKTIKPATGTGGLY
jgi:hypothetical protein